MNTTDQPTPEPGWRMLDVGEVIQEGDEVNSVYYGKWVPVGMTIGLTLHPTSKGTYRRRLPSQPETPSGPPDALPPKDEAQGETPRRAMSGLERKIISYASYSGGMRLTHDEIVELAALLKSRYGDSRHGPDDIDQLQRALAAAEGDASNWADRHEHVYQQLLTSQSKLAKLQSALNGVLAETKEKLVECGYNPLVVEDFDSFVNSRVALDELQAIKAKPLPVPQTPQEHIEDVMKVGFNRGCG